MKFESEPQKINDAESVELDRKKFDGQYDNPQAVEVDGEKFFIHDVIPENQTHETPILVAPGWIEDPVNGKETVYVWYKDGYRVLWADAPHGIPSEPQKGIAQAELRKAKALLKTLEVKNIPKAVIVAHSEGGLNATIAATLEPEKIQDIIYVHSAGMIGKDNILSLVVRASREGKRGAKANEENPPEYAFKTDAERNKKYFTDPRTYQEVWSIAKSNIHESMENLKRKGIGISVVHGVDDEEFPMSRIQKETSGKHVHGFYSVKGGHQHIIEQPTMYGKVIEEAIKGLDSRRKEEENKSEK